MLIESSDEVLYGIIRTASFTLSSCPELNNYQPLTVCLGIGTCKVIELIPSLRPKLRKLDDLQKQSLIGLSTSACTVLKTHFDCISDGLSIPHLLELPLVNASPQRKSLKFGDLAFIFQVSQAINDIPQTRMNFASKTMLD